MSLNDKLKFLEQKRIYAAEQAVLEDLHSKGICGASGQPCPFCSAEPMNSAEILSTLSRMAGPFYGSEEVLSLLDKLIDAKIREALLAAVQRTEL